jgi:hypothetical protein
MSASVGRITEEKPRSTMERREWDSNFHPSFRFCKLQIPKSQGFQQRAAKTALIGRIRRATATVAKSRPVRVVWLHVRCCRLRGGQLGNGHRYDFKILDTRKVIWVAGIHGKAVGQGGRRNHRVVGAGV